MYQPIAPTQLKYHSLLHAEAGLFELFSELGLSVATEMSEIPVHVGYNIACAGTNTTRHPPG